MNTLWQDVRYALRMLLRKPGYTVVAVITLALGIGANTAIFSVINAVLLRPLPYAEPDRLMKLWTQGAPTSMSKAEFVEIRDNAQSFQDLAAYSGWSFTLTGSGEPAKLSGARTTAGFFSLLGVDAEVGRTFAADEDTPEHSHVVILGHGLWQSRFGADASIVGQSITLQGESHTIIGVLPASFRFPGVSGTGQEADVIVPAPLDPTNKNDFKAGYLNIAARLKPGVTQEQAHAELISVVRNAKVKFPRAPDNYGLNATVVSLAKEVLGDTRSTLFILLAAVAFVLLIACANVANLQLARTTARNREMAIRAALGASRLRIVRQLLTESLLLSLVGGAAGVLLALWGIESLVSLLPSDIPRLNAIAIDFPVLGFSFAASVVTGILFGLTPALQSSRPSLQDALKEGGRTSTTAKGSHVRNLMMVTEVALALMLVIGAGLLIKSFWRVQQVDPGFKAENVLSFQVAPPDAAYAEESRKILFYRQAIERIEQLPGVKAVGGIHLRPMGDGNWDPGLTVEDHQLPPGAMLPSVDWRLITPNYFQAMGVTLIKGRFFDDHDTEKSPRVAIVNETFARQYWPDEDPIGKRIRSGFEGKEWAPIVGVVGDVKEQRLYTATHPEMYRPYEQSPFVSFMTLMVRAESDPAALVGAIREQVRGLDKDVLVADVQPLTRVLSESVSKPRSTMLLMAVFAAIALSLGTIGIYGVVSYSVTQRTHEIGVRIALGAATKDVLRLVVGQGMKMILVGLAIGLAGAVATTRALESLLFGVSAIDPVTFVAVSVLLTGVALVACFVPARRAMKVDPMVALRYE